MSFMDGLNLDDYKERHLGHPLPPRERTPEDDQKRPVIRVGDLIRTLQSFPSDTVVSVIAGCGCCDEHKRLSIQQATTGGAHDALALQEEEQVVEIFWDGCRCDLQRCNCGVRGSRAAC